MYDAKRDWLCPITTVVAHRVNAKISR